MALTFTLFMRHVICQKKKKLRLRKNVTLQDEGYLGDQQITSQIFIYHTWRRSQWSHVLRRPSAAIRLLGLRVRIPPGA